jgi:hypothetical protein
MRTKNTILKAIHKSFLDSLLWMYSDDFKTLSALDFNQTQTQL